MNTFMDRSRWARRVVLMLTAVPAWAQASRTPSGAPPSAATRAIDDDRKNVESVAQAFADCWNRHDMEAFAQLFAEDAEFVNVVGLWWRGREEIKRAHLATHATMFKSSRLVMTKTSVRFLSADVAIARCSWELTGHTGPAGEPVSKRIGLLMNVLARRGDQWLIVDAQNTDIIEGVLAPPQPVNES